MPSLDNQRHDQFLRLFAKHVVALHTLLRAMLPPREDASEELQETITGVHVLARLAWVFTVTFPLQNVKNLWQHVPRR